MKCIMDDDNTNSKKTVKVKRFFKGVRGWKRFFLFTGIYLVTFLVLFAAAAEYTSQAVILSHMSLYGDILSKLEVIRA